MRVNLVSSAVASVVLAAPASAQMNPAAIGGGLVMPAAINAQAHGGRGGGVSEDLKRENRANCAAVPSFHRQYGAANPKVRQLVSNCRKLGYNTGD